MNLDYYGNTCSPNDRDFAEQYSPHREAMRSDLAYRRMVDEWRDRHCKQDTVAVYMPLINYREGRE